MVAPAIAAAGLTAGAGLLQALMQQEQQKQAMAEAARQDRLRAARDELARANQNQLGAISQAGQSEQSALSQMIAALARTAR